MIPDFARSGNLLGIDYDPINIPSVLPVWDNELDGDYIRTAQTIHVEDEIERFDNPVLIIHGAADEVVPLDYVKRAENLYKNAKLVLIDGADHCYGGQTEELSEAIREFFK